MCDHCYECRGKERWSSAIESVMFVPQPREMMKTPPHTNALNGLLHTLGKPQSLQKQSNGGVWGDRGEGQLVTLGHRLA